MNRSLFHATLNKHWGYTSFRDAQLEVIESVCSGRDTLALMPTGAGKSLLYQVPTMATDGLCIVVTPLISLMKDQVDRLRGLGISAAAIHSGLTARQIDITLDNCSWGDVKFLYIAPERASGELFRTRLRGMNISLLAVDEAHCISQWGYDFRPSYLRIAELRELLPDVPVLALTASATPPVARDIMRNLHMSEGVTIRSSFSRPNLSFAVRHSDNKQEQLLRIAANVPGTGIVYVRTRDQTVKLTDWLGDHGIPATSYHGGLSAPERTLRQERWMSGASRIMVATNAFGMGIDKPDVRFVVHYDLCDSVEAYYQEAGRAGRDGGRAFAVLLAGSDERSKASRRFTTEFPPLDKIRECYRALFNYLRIGFGDGKYSTFSFDLYDFSSRARMSTSTAYNSLKILQQNGYLTLTDETDNPPRIMFTVGRDDLYKIRIDHHDLDHIIRTLLRLYTGVFSERLISIDEQELARVSGYTVEKVRDLLRRLWRLRIIRYVPGNRSPLLILNEERLPDHDVRISPESYHIRKEMTLGRIKAMHDYSCQDEICRSVMLRRYFGESDASDCGSCDVCLARKKEKNDNPSPPSVHTPSPLDSQITGLLRRTGPLHVRDIVMHFGSPPLDITDTIDSLLSSGTIFTASDGKVAIKQVPLPPLPPPPVRFPER